MVGTGFSVAPSVLRAASGVADSTARDLLDLIAGFEATALEAEAATGHPVAQDAVGGFAAHWLARLAELEQLLGGLRDGLAVSAIAYETTDGAAATAVLPGRRVDG